MEHLMGLAHSDPLTIALVLSQRIYPFCEQRSSYDWNWGYGENGTFFSVRCRENEDFVSHIAGKSPTARW